MGGNDGEDELSTDEPVTALQAARQAMGWKQSRVLAALTEQAKRDRVSIAGPGSLKTMLSRWENGNGQPDATYQRLFCAVYEREPDELGFGRTTTRTARALAAPVLNTDTVAYFSDVLEQHIRADYLLGPQHLVDVVRAQTELLDRILPDTRPGAIRDALFRLACRYNELTGWLYQDAGTRTPPWSTRIVRWIRPSLLMTPQSSSTCSCGRATSPATAAYPTARYRWPKRPLDSCTRQSREPAHSCLYSRPARTRCVGAVTIPFALSIAPAERSVAPTQARTPHELLHAGIRRDGVGS
jgi:transcriptional regulator with XRE-family HTH domain